MFIIGIKKDMADHTNGSSKYINFLRSRVNQRLLKGSFFGPILLSHPSTMKSFVKSSANCNNTKHSHNAAPRQTQSAKYLDRWEKLHTK